MSEHTALIIIDLQKGIIHGLGGARQAEHDAALDALAVRTGELLRRARAAGAPVIFVQHSGPAGHRLEPGTKLWELRDEIAPLAGEPVVHKHFSDSFFETTLEAELRARKVQRLAVAGCMTQYCIDTNVRRAVSVGFDVSLASDGHTTADFGTLRFEQIIAHHNRLLDGFDAGEHSVTVLPMTEIRF